MNITNNTSGTEDTIATGTCICKSIEAFFLKARSYSITYLHNYLYKLQPFFSIDDVLLDFLRSFETVIADGIPASNEWKHILSAKL